jgi:hypothetical protein
VPVPVPENVPVPRARTVPVPNQAATRSAITRARIGVG